MQAVERKVETYFIIYLKGVISKRGSVEQNQGLAVKFGALDLKFKLTKNRYNNVKFTLVSFKQLI